MIYCKTLHPDDYNIGTYPQHIENIVKMMQFNRVMNRFEHPHRKWEYAMCLNALEDSPNKLSTVLDVGGGGSILAPALAWIDYDVTQVDPGDCSGWVEDQSWVINKPLKYIQQDFFEFPKEYFDAVLCMSTIEHVPDDMGFFDRLLTYVRKGGIIVLTTDFHPSGKQLVGGHLRTYNEKHMHDFINYAKPDFEIFGDGTDYSHFEPYVNTYTFAMLVLRRLE